MGNMEEAKKSLHDALELAVLAVEECEAKLKAIDQIKLDLSRHHNDIVKIEAAIRALEGPGASDAANHKLNKKLAERAPAPSGLPPTGLDFFEECVSEEPMRVSDLYPVVVRKMGLSHVTAEQSAAIKARMYNSLSMLAKLHRIVSDGMQGSTTYHKNPPKE